MRSAQADFNRKVHCIMGLPFDAITLEHATAQVREAAFNRTPCFISTPNLNFLITSQRNEAFRQSVIKSDLSLADGMPIIWMAKLMSIPITERVAGSDLFEALRKSPGRKIKVYFFGGQPGVAEKAMRILNTEAGGMECVGFETPGFGSIEEMSTPESIAKINASGAEFLVVSLGAVKGQAWIEHNLDALNVPVVSHLGAVVNFVAGNVRRAPQWMQKTGLEWIWRIVEEPSLWKRYYFDGLGLLKLGTQLLAYAKSSRKLGKGDRKNQTSLAIQHSCNNGNLKIAIAGVCRAADLAPLKELLKQSENQYTNISMDLERVSALDSAFLGLLTLVSGQQLNRHRVLKIEND